MLLEEAAEEMPEFEEEGDRGRFYEVPSGQVPQRWLVVYSAQAAEREANTFHRRREKAREQMEKKGKTLERRQFACRAEAQVAR